MKKNDPREHVEIIAASSPRVLIKVSTVISIMLLLFAVGGAAFVGGYSLAFSKVSDVHAETSVLKARAAELETELLHLKNYAVLIDAMAVQGRAAGELYNLPQTPFELAPDTVVDTVYLKEAQDE